MNLPLPAHFAIFLVVLSPIAHALTPGQVFEKVKGSVVVIKTLDEKGEVLKQGSGVILPSGKIATNCHVVKDGVHFEAGRGKSLVPATLYAGDDDMDICLLQADTLSGTPAQIGKAATLKVGEAVYAVGAPRGLELSLSDGIVSQLRGGSPPFIQTTAAISHGSSGGGLFDSEGQLVGFTTLYIDDGQSLNFAMPVEWLADLKPGKKTASKQHSSLDWLTRAAALEEKQDWPGLLDWGKQWTKTEPDNPVAWFSVGSAYQRLDQVDDAIAAYRQALHINPEYAETWNHIGATYYGVKRYDDAIVAYRQALRINPEIAKAWNNLGLAYYDIKRYDDTIAAFRQALRIEPEYTAAWYSLGNTNFLLKRYDDAINAYRQALRINPANADTWNNLGLTYGKLKRHDDAIAAYRQALGINPEYANAWTNLAISYAQSGNTTAALQAVKALRPLDPAIAEELFNLIVPR
jgi:tetratricopeptide (TPR) repeat protein